MHYAKLRMPIHSFENALKAYTAGSRVMLFSQQSRELKDRSKSQLTGWCLRTLFLPPVWPRNNRNSRTQLVLPCRETLDFQLWRTHMSLKEWTCLKASMFVTWLLVTITALQSQQVDNCARGGESQLRYLGLASSAPRHRQEKAFEGQKCALLAAAPAATACCSMSLRVSKCKTWAQA